MRIELPLFEEEEDYPIEVLSRISIDLSTINGSTFGLEETKPYLRSMSSMTDEEYKEYSKLWDLQDEFPTDADIRFKIDVFDWLNARHFDYRGLIPLGLAIEVTEKNNPYKD